MKHELKNGIYYRDGEAKLALGVSYYPSFHPGKYQVPESGDRIGELKKDFRDIADCGFDYVRVAALGEVTADGDRVTVNTDFIDETMNEAQRRGLAMSVRLQGYVMNLRGNTDYIMLNHRNEEMALTWANFMHASFFHEGVLRDNLDATRALAEHFLKWDNLISYQIFNEPHFASNGVFDYHPATLAAYRKDLVARGVMTEAEAEAYEIPRHRPDRTEDVALWADWRDFAKRSMCEYLNKCAYAAEQVAPQIDRYTCYTSSPVSERTANLGTTYFDGADSLTSVGLTHYTNFTGSAFYTAMLSLCQCECAAALHHKAAWLAELDARTHITLQKFLLESVAAVGVGFKGINYYEWRGDYPAENTPKPDNCGLIFNDRTKTEGFDEKLRMVRLLNRISPAAVTASRVRSGCAILYSDHIISVCDAGADPILGGLNRAQLYTHHIFKDLLRFGITADFVEASDMEENLFGVRYLFLPAAEYLTDSDRAAVDAFRAKGGKVFGYAKFRRVMCEYGYDGYYDLDTPVVYQQPSEFSGGMDIEDLIELYDLVPHVASLHRTFHYELLENETQYLLCVMNTAESGSPIPEQTVTLNGLAPVASATWLDIDGETELSVKGEALTLPPLPTAAFILLEKK